MKLAVLLYGQPRFLNLTYKRIKEEYNIPGVDVRFFIHFWEEIGYYPLCDRHDNYTIDDNISQYIDYIKPEKIKIEGFNDLDNLTVQLQNTLNFLQFKEVSNRGFKSKDRYKFGQHLSLHKAYNLMELYEKENNIKFDIVTKTRTDFVYNKDKNNRYDSYIVSKNKIHLNCAIASGLSMRTYNVENQEFVGSKLNEYLPDFNLKEKQLHCNIRMDDINVSTTRTAAKYFFTKWFSTFIRTFIFDMDNNTEGSLRSYKGHDVIQGDIALYYKINVIRRPIKRYIRLYLKDKCKAKWITGSSIDVTNIKNEEDLIY